MLTSADAGDEEIARRRVTDDRFKGLAGDSESNTTRAKKSPLSIITVTYNTTLTTASHPSIHIEWSSF